MPPLLQKMTLKSLSEPIFQISNMAAPSCIDNEVKSLAFSFSDFFLGEIMMYFRERDVITGGFPQKSGIPHDFVYDFVS